MPRACPVEHHAYLLCFMEMKVFKLQREPPRDKPVASHYIEEQAFFSGHRESPRVKPVASK